MDAETETAIAPTPEAAFDRAAVGYEFAGQVLKKFNGLRQNAAAKMGLRFGMVDEKDIFTVTVETLKDKEKVKTDLQFYNQMFGDVVSVIWLCTVPITRVLKACRKVDQATEEAFAWADANGITLTSTQYFEAAGVFFQMMQDIAVSTAVPTQNNETDPDYDPNE